MHVLCFPNTVWLNCYKIVMDFLKIIYKKHINYGTISVVSVAELSYLFVVFFQSAEVERNHGNR